MTPGANAKTAARWALAASSMTAATGFAATVSTGAAPLLAVTIQSVAGASSLALMLYGLSRAAEKSVSTRTPATPLAHYFWAFVAAIFPAAFGAGALMVEGISRLWAPESILYPGHAYAALGTAIAVTAFAARRAARAAPRRRVDDPSAFATLVHMLAALAGLVAALAGMVAADRLALPAAEAAAAIVVALILAASATVFAVEIKALLVRGVQRETPAAASEPTSVDVPRAAPAMATLPDRRSGLDTDRVAGRDVERDAAGNLAAVAATGASSAPHAAAATQLHASRKARKKSKRRH